MKRRTFIVYLEPSGDSAMAKHVNTARNLLGTSIGYDESHLYPLHCSLTSFFDVVLPEDATVRSEDEEEVLNKAIRDALSSYISCRFEGAASSLLPALDNKKVPPRWSPSSFCSTRSCSARSRSSSLSAFAEDTAAVPDDQANHHNDGTASSSLSTTSSVEDPTPLPDASFSPSINIPTTAAYFRVKRQLSSSESQAPQQQPKEGEQTNLKHVHITPDGSLIYPLTADGLSKESIMYLCQTIQESIHQALPKAEVKGSRKPAPGIQPKQATHMTLLSNKGNKTQDPTWSVHRMAQFLDRAASVTVPHLTEWDVVVNELQRWGSLDGPKGESGSRFEVVHPHVFVEVCRLRGIGISALQ